MFGTDRDPEVVEVSAASAILGSCISDARSHGYAKCTFHGLSVEACLSNSKGGNGLRVQLRLAGQDGTPVFLSQHTFTVSQLQKLDRLGVI
jgi:hypothetical protein